jgi:hypothetical protein
VYGTYAPKKTSWRAKALKALLRSGSARTPVFSSTIRHENGDLG